jgi:hypothetical protein
VIVVFLAYLGIHFGLYVLLLRNWAWFRQERTIFMYHAIGALSATVAVLVILATQPTADTLAAVVLVVSLQGIYSISFLEVWSLAQGGYSIGILSRFEEAARAGTQPDLAELEKIGAGKKSDRLAGLQRLALIELRSDGLGLRGRGRAVSAALHVLLRLVNRTEAG